MSDTDEHPHPARAPRQTNGALDWRVVGLVALLAGGGGGTTLASALQPNTRELATSADVERLRREVETLSDAVSSSTLKTAERIADHEARLRALEKGTP